MRSANTVGRAKKEKDQGKMDKNGKANDKPVATAAA
jgi:hypothetical protein